MKEELIRVIENKDLVIEDYIRECQVGKEKITIWTHSKSILRKIKKDGLK